MASLDWNTRGRLLAAWHGQRNLGQRLLELAVKGFEDFPQAGDALVTAQLALGYETLPDFFGVLAGDAGVPAP